MKSEAKIRWDIIIAAAISATPPTIVAMIGVSKIEQVHKATNSMKDELVEATREAAHASGVADEREDAASRPNGDNP